MLALGDRPSINNLVHPRSVVVPEDVDGGEKSSGLQFSYTRLAAADELETLKMSPAFSVSVVIFPRAERAQIATSPALNAVRASVRKRRVVGKASEDEEDGGACSAN
jgi:hypothetical protein